MRSPLPSLFLGVAARLRDGGETVCFAGEGLAQRVLAADPSALRSPLEVMTSAAPARIAELFDDAVQTSADGRQWSLPTAAGTLVMAPLSGRSATNALASRCFTLTAIGFDPHTDTWLDPIGGRADLAAGRLHCASESHLSENPLRAIEAARLVSAIEIGSPGAASTALRVSPELRSAMCALKLGISRSTREPARAWLRRQIAALLLGPQCGAALSLLRETKLEEQLVPGAAADCAQVVPAMPPELDRRLLAWLRGTRASRVLRSLRWGRGLSDPILVLLDDHPIDQAVRPGDVHACERLLAKLGEASIAQLVALRRIEAAGLSARDAAQLDARLAELEVGLERARQRRRIEAARHSLAIGGEEVMQHLRLEPGREIGQALAHLAELVADGRCANERDALTRALDAWRQGPGSGSGSSDATR